MTAQWVVTSPLSPPSRARTRQPLEWIFLFQAMMPRSLATRLSLLSFPPAQRLHHAVRALNQSVDWLMTENRSCGPSMARLANRVSELAAPAAPSMPPSARAGQCHVLNRNA